MKGQTLNTIMGIEESNDEEVTETIIIHETLDQELEEETKSDMCFAQRKGVFCIQIMINNLLILNWLYYVSSSA